MCHFFTDDCVSSDELGYKDTGDELQHEDDDVNDDEDKQILTRTPFHSRASTASPTKQTIATTTTTSTTVGNTKKLLVCLLLCLCIFLV